MAGAEVHPYSRALYEHCRGKPEAKEDHPWDETVFKIRGRVFAFLGHMDKGGVTVKVPPEDLDVVLEQPGIKRARYVGRFGWVSLRVADDDELERAKGMIDDSYDLVASAAR